MKSLLAFLLLAGSAGVSAFADEVQTAAPMCAVPVASAAASAVSAYVPSAGDMLFLFLGAVMVFSMHAGFAFLELGTVRHKSQVNALNKILVDWAMSTLVYFFIGYPLARGISFMAGAETLALNNGVELMKFFFFLTFAACIPAIISGGIAERTKFWPMLLCNALLVGAAYPLFEGLIWGRWAFDASGSAIGIQKFFCDHLGGCFEDFAGSVVVHSIGGWLALPAIIMVGSRIRRFQRTPPPSNIPFLALGSWILCIGWFGFNVGSAAALNSANGLVAVNSLMAMVGGILASVAVSRNDAGFTHNGAIAGLIAICSGSAIVHPAAAFVIGAIAGLLFHYMFSIETERFKIDDVLGVWPLHGLAGSWGGIATGIFGSKALFGATKNVSFLSQLAGTLFAIVFALGVGFALFGFMRFLVGLRLEPHEELIGSDRTIHHIESCPEDAL